MSNCNFDPEVGITTTADFYADPQNLPRVGDVFYVRTRAARVAGGCGINMSVHPEVVAPLGVTPAISAQTPVESIWRDIDTGVTTAAEGCPQQSSRGIHGLAFDQVASGGERTAWSIPFGMELTIRIPLRSARRLAGPASQLPSCGRSEGEPPCRADQSGDHCSSGTGSSTATRARG